MKIRMSNKPTSTKRKKVYNKTSVKVATKLMTFLALSSVRE
jgi:hypothetical protein